MDTENRLLFVWGRGVEKMKGSKGSINDDGQRLDFVW